MANNRNNQPQDDNSLEAFLRADKDKRMKERLTDLETTKKSLETQRDIIKNIKAVYTPVSKTQTLMVDFNKNQVNANRTLQSAIDKNTELLKQNVSNTKSLYNMLEKNFEKLGGISSAVQSKPSKKENDNFDNKAKHEQSILAGEDSTVPILKSIKSDTAKIVKILEGNAKQEKEKVSQPKDSLFDNLPNSLKFLPWILPLVAGVVAAQNKEIGNAAKAGLGVATTAARLGAPLLEAARTGAAGASGLSKAAAAAAAARAAMNGGTFRAAMSGPAPLGTLGKVGVGLGAGATVGRAMEGDTAGATAQGISTLLPLLLAKTKYGKLAGLASAGIDVGLLGRDYIKYADGKSSEEVVESDPVVANTAETNKILEQIRDGGGLSLGTTASVAMPAIAAASAAILLKGKLGSGAATTGMGQRMLGGLSSAGKAGLGVAGKSVGKLIPGLGLAIGAYGAYDKIKEGDMMGALLEGGSGIASLFPGVGTAIAIGLQGMSATRDVMKANSDKTNETVLKSANETNASLANANNTVSSTILSNSELTNKNIESSAKTANDSLTKSANTLTSTGNTLASTLTGASNTLLGMIAKYSLPGAVAQGMQAVGNYFTGAPEANPLAQGHSNLHSSRKNNMMSVYNAMIKAGMSDNQARAMTAEVGRENSFGNNIWKSHRDDKNGKLNMGMMSWQGDRAEKLMKFMKAKGLVNPDGSLQRSQAAIDAQAEFMVHEMKTNYSGVGKKFLGNKNISYADASKLLGKEYIQWAYTNPKYASGHANRDAYYADLNNEIHKRGGHKKQNIKYVSQKEMDKLSKAEARPPMMASAKVQSEWKKREDARIKKHSEISKGVIAGTHKIGTAPKSETGSSSAVPYASGSAKDEGSTKKDTPSNKEFYNKGVQNVIIAKGVDMNGLTTSCREAFFTMIGELFSSGKVNKKPVVSSAYRSPQKQQALWQAELKKQGGDESKARKWVAPPGKSKHEKGLALDVDYKGGATVKLLESSGLLAKYNFSRPLSNEPWHIEYGSGSVGAAASALGSAVGDFIGAPDFTNASEAADAAIAFAAQGMSTMLSGGAMDSIRDFIKGGKIDAPKDKYDRPTAVGVFTQDESDPSRSLPKDIGNGVFWENLDQQLGNGTLQRQERDQAEYDKVKKAWEGKQGIFRQIGGKYGWLSEMFSGLFGEDNLLSNVFGVLTGSQDISGLPGVLGKSITGQNASLDRIGVMGGGFGGGLASNNSDVYPLTYDDTFNRYEDQEFQRAKATQKETEDQRRRIEVSMPPPATTPTQQAPSGGKSSRQGLTGGATFTRNPDSIIQQVAIAMMRSSL